MLDTAITMAAQPFVNYKATGEVQPLIGNSSPAFLPTAGLFETGDGRLMISALTDGHWRGFCKAIGRDDLAEDPRFIDTEARRANGAQVKIEMEAGLANANAFDWEKRLAACGVPAAPQLPVNEALDHPALKHRDVLLEFNGIPGIERPLMGIGTGFKANVDGPKADRPPPMLDQHRDEILKDL